MILAGGLPVGDEGVVADAPVVIAAVEVRLVRLVPESDAQGIAAAVALDDRLSGLLAVGREDLQTFVEQLARELARFFVEFGNLHTRLADRAAGSGIGV